MNCRSLEDTHLFESLFQTALGINECEVDVNKMLSSTYKLSLDIASIEDTHRRTATIDLRVALNSAVCTVYVSSSDYFGTLLSPHSLLYLNSVGLYPSFAVSFWLRIPFDYRVFKGD